MVTIIRFAQAFSMKFYIVKKHIFLIVAVLGSLCNLKATNTDSLNILAWQKSAKLLLENNGDSAYYLYKKATRASKKGKHTTLEIESLIGMAKYFRNSEETDSSIFYLSRADSLCKSYSTSCAKVWAEKAEINEIGGNKVAAIDDLFKLLNHASVAQDTPYVIYSSYRIASIYYYLGRYIDSREICFQYLPYCDSSEYGLNHFQFFHNTLGNIYNEIKPDSALFFFEKARQIAIDRDDSTGLIFAENNIANHYIKAKKYEPAVKILKNCLKFTSYHNITRAKAANHVNLGICYFNIDSFELAEFHLKKGLVISKKANLMEYSVNGHNQLSVLYLKLNMKDAYYLAKDSFYYYTKKLDEASKTQQVSKLNYYKTVIENEKKQKALLEQNTRNREKIYKRNLLITAISAIALIAFFLLHNNIRKNKIISKQSQQLKAYNAQLETINTRKDQMLSIVSHDLKGPLNNIAYLQTEFTKDNIDYDTLKPLSIQLTSSVNTANNLLDSILSWAKLFVEGKLKKEPFNLKDVLHDVKNQLSFNATKKDISITVDTNNEHELATDKNVLSIVLRNIMSNAIKFTPVGGSVNVYTTSSQSTITVNVKDTGSGFNKRVAEKFNTAETAQLDSFQGTNGEKGNGLGLMLSKEFARQIDCHISIESTNASGTVMSITIPKDHSKSID